MAEQWNAQEHRMIHLLTTSTTENVLLVRRELAVGQDYEQK